MIEIKFRAWDTNKKILFNVSEIHFGNNFYIKGLGDIFSRNFVLMQYTGLKDKNGKEIYEGDILKTLPYHNEKSELVIVEFTKFEKCGGCPYQHQGVGFDIGEYDTDHLEIIGNIYENPELLEKK